MLMTQTPSMTTDMVLLVMLILLSMVLLVILMLVFVAHVHLHITLVPSSVNHHLLRLLMPRIIHIIWIMRCRL